MNQGVIRPLKAKYRFLAVKKQIDAVEKGNQLPKCSILTAMFMLTKAWNSIPDGKFTNCFKKSGISEKSTEKALNDEGDPFASLDAEEDVMESLRDDLEMMKEKLHENYGMTITVLEDYSLLSNFGANLMKALKDVNRGFDLDYISNKIFSKLCKHFNKMKDRKKKNNSLFRNSTVSLIRTLIFPSLRFSN